MTPESAVKPPKFERFEDGSIVRWVKDKPEKIAQYDAEFGTLVYENEDVRAKYCSKVVSLVEFTDEGKTATGDKITKSSIKGRPEDKISPKEPTCPKPTKSMGDKTKAIVEWFFKWRPQEAYVKYGVQLDKNDEPIRVTGRRVNKIMRTNPTTELSEYIEDVFSGEGFLATRGTHMTFTKEEVVGYTDGSDDNEEYAPEETE